MRLTCPYCSDRDVGEFIQFGEDPGKRPDPGHEQAQSRFVDYVHLRDNSAGPNNELWYHAGGCRQWLRVVRNTKTHEVISVQLAGAGSKDGRQQRRQAPPRIRARPSPTGWPRAV